LISATLEVARLSSLSFIFDSVMLRLAKNRSVTAKHSSTIKTARGAWSDPISSVGFLNSFSHN
jgi:hypothetical protein